MKSFLRTEEITIRGEPLTIRELTARDHIAMDDLKGAEFVAAICKHSVIEWEEESLEDIQSKVPLSMLNEIAEKIYELSGVDAAKNSVSVPSVDFSSASARN